MYFLTQAVCIDMSQDGKKVDKNWPPRSPLCSEVLYRSFGNIMFVGVFTEVFTQSSPDFNWCF